MRCAAYGERAIVSQTWSEEIVGGENSQSPEKAVYSHATLPMRHFSAVIPSHLYKIKRKCSESPRLRAEATPAPCRF
jgi:hypothetical protein